MKRTSKLLLLCSLGIFSVMVRLTMLFLSLGY